ncbi:hypothetical protein D3C86_2004310 [compost metagenome]
MIIAGILFLAGLLIGLSGGGYPAILTTSILATAAAFSTWLFRSELQVFSLFVWIGYMFALQSGFVLGGYLSVPADDD